MHDCYFVFVAATHRACTLLSSGLPPPIARCCIEGRKYRGSKISKSSSPKWKSFSERKWVLYVRNGHHILSSACTGEERQARSFRVSGDSLSVSSGLPISHQAAHSASGSATAGIPDRVFPSGLTCLSCPSTRTCRLAQSFRHRGL